MNAESNTIVVAQPTNRVSPARLGREQDAGMALFPPGQLPSTQIPADWGQNDPTKPDYIKNKPAIPSEPSDIGAATSAQGAKADSAYQKPAGGIPASDLASGVIPSVPVKAVKSNGTALTPDANGAVDVTVPTGTAAAKDVPTTGDASATQVVMGDDSRLTNARTPTTHNHRLEYGYSNGVFTEQPEGTMFKANNKGDIVPAVAGTDYVSPSSLASVATTGSYYSLTDKPTIPTVPTNVSAFVNDAGYLTQHQDISDKLDASKRNLLDYTSGTTLALGTAVYRSALNADGTFPTISATAIPTASAYFQFELEMAVPSTVPSTITGPSGWTWLDGHGLPDPADLSGGETICISVRLDCTARTFLASVWRAA